jgi:hypothetical protein
MANRSKYDRMEDGACEISCFAVLPVTKLIGGLAAVLQLIIYMFLCTISSFYIDLGPQLRK